MSEKFSSVKIISAPTADGHPTEMFLNGVKVKGLADYSIDHPVFGGKRMRIEILVDDIVIEHPEIIR